MKKQPVGIGAAALLAALVAACLVSSCGTTGQARPSAGAPPAVTTPSGVEMVAIPGGWFEMGSEAEDETDAPVHRVYVSPFLMDRYEVTQEHFEKVVGRNPSRWKDPKGPVEQIRWRDAAQYCNARSRLEGLVPCYDPATWRCDESRGGYRLPTEAEWEYACRAGTRTEYSFGNNPAKLKQFAWFKENCTRSPQPVGSRQPNPWGLYDMYGNVWEWCNDFYKEGYYGESPEKDPRGPDTSLARVLRGGCWNSRATMCRSAYRNNEDPGYTDACFGRDVHGQVGFRCVRSVPETAATER
ncbi:MAG: formylglycine-generating enzyme family protein [Planctomycetota bacterium]|nr:formylglycine-generating enzyme family protein [Planctomycetota bacterium]